MTTSRRSDQCISCAYPIDTNADIFSVLSRIKAMVSHVGYSVARLNIEDTSNEEISISLTLHPKLSPKRPRPSSHTSDPPAKRTSLPVPGCRRCVSSCCSSNSLCKANVCNHRNEEESAPVPASPEHHHHHKHAHHHSHARHTQPHNSAPSAPMSQRLQPSLIVPDPSIPSPSLHQHTDPSQQQQQQQQSSTLPRRPPPLTSQRQSQQQQQQQPQQHKQQQQKQLQSQPKQLALPKPHQQQQNQQQPSPSRTFAPATPELRDVPQHSHSRLQEVHAHFQQKDLFSAQPSVPVVDPAPSMGVGGTAVLSRSGVVSTAAVQTSSVQVSMPSTAAPSQEVCDGQKGGWTTSSMPGAVGYEGGDRLALEFNTGVVRKDEEAEGAELDRGRGRVEMRPQPELVCRPCGRRFEEELDLRKHEFMDHKDSTKEVARTAEGRFLCLMHSCTQSFVRRHVMERHFKTVHLMVKEFACPNCEKSFADSSTRDTHHTAVHEKRKPWICDQCSSCFTQSSSLGKHRRRFHKDTVGAGSQMAQAAQAALNPSHSALDASQAAALSAAQKQ